MAGNFVISQAVENVLAELEVQRKKIVSANIKGWGAVILGILVAIVTTSLAGLVVGIILGAVGIIYGGITLYKIGNDANQYKSRFKREVIGVALSSIDPNLTLDPNNGISEAEFVQSQLFAANPDRYKTEDLVRGKDRKTSFYFAEVHAEYKTETRTKNGTRTTWHNILKGIVFVADFNKNFSGVTVIRPKDFGSSIGAWFSKNIYSFGDKNIIELENDGFNKNFVTYGTDQVEARYILTPAMMEKINDLNERSAYTVSLSFTNSCMYIAFPLDKNYFEAPIYRTLLNPDLLDDDFSILSFMYALISELDLNTRIWTKQ